MHTMFALGRRAHHGPWPLIRCATTHWAATVSTIGAALAFYCAFSLAPLLIILVTLMGWFVGSEMAYGQLSAQLTALFGQGTARIFSTQWRVRRALTAPSQQHSA